MWQFQRIDFLLDSSTYHTNIGISNCTINRRSSVGITMRNLCWPIDLINSCPWRADGKVNILPR